MLDGGFERKGEVMQSASTVCEIHKTEQVFPYNE